MSKYYKNIAGDYITAIGAGLGDAEITQEEYENILSIVRSRPTAGAGYDYRLRTDLTWEQVELSAWEQPDSTNAYGKGDKVAHNGKTWVSTLDNNSWEPGVYGWDEVTGG